MTLMRADSNTHRMLAGLSAMAVAIGLAVSTAPTARADENDEAFLKALFHRDIRPTGDPAGLVYWAHWTCDQLNQGAEDDHVLAWLGQYRVIADPRVFGDSTEVFVHEATHYYCPAHQDRFGW
jgi:hypothetical protein